MKIALFTETFLPKVDGIVTRLTKTIEFLIKNGDEVIIFCPEGCPESYMGATVVGVAAMPLPLYPELKLGLPGPAVSDKLEKFNPDLIHVVNPAVLGLGGIWLAKTNNIPLIASYHTHLPKYLEHYGMGMLEPLLWELLKAAHNQALLNLCTSTAMVNELKDKGIQRTALWQRGVDTLSFRPDLRSEKMREKLFGKYKDANYLLIYVARLSLQSHKFRSEHWVVVEGVATVELNGKVSKIKVNHSTYINIGDKHRLSNFTKNNLTIIEVQIGTYLGEDDIIRYDDIYKRK